jgi:DNA polymerase III, delta subunit
MGAGKFRVYIMDEAHGMSGAAQDLLLDLFEDTPESTVFILLTTNPSGISETLRSRCQGYQMRELVYTESLVLIERLLKRANSTLPADRLADALEEKGIHSPRLIAQAVEKYYVGIDPDEAANVDIVADVDVHPLMRAVVKGAWGDSARFIAKAQPNMAQGIRLGVMSYLKTMLLETHEMNERTGAVAKALGMISSVETKTDNLTMMSMVTYQIYKLCTVFDVYKH